MYFWNRRVKTRRPRFFCHSSGLSSPDPRGWRSPTPLASALPVSPHLTGPTSPSPDPDLTLALTPDPCPSLWGCPQAAAPAQQAPLRIPRSALGSGVAQIKASGPQSDPTLSSASAADRKKAQGQEGWGRINSSRLHVHPPQSQRAGMRRHRREGSVSPAGKQNGSGPPSGPEGASLSPRRPPALALGQAWGHLTPHSRPWHGGGSAQAEGCWGRGERQ